MLKVEFLRNALSRLLRLHFAFSFAKCRPSPHRRREDSKKNARDESSCRGRLGRSGAAVKERLQAVISLLAAGLPWMMRASTDNCCYRSGALVTGVRFVAGIRVDGHHHGNVTALYRARFRYQA